MNSTRECFMVVCKDFLEILPVITSSVPEYSESDYMPLISRDAS